MILLMLYQVLGEGNFGKVWKAEVDDICGYEGTILVAVKGVKVVDPTGCGDAFSAGFLHAWLSGADLRGAAGWASMVAAKCASGAGANETASCSDDVQEFIRGLEREEEEECFAQLEGA